MATAWVFTLPAAALVGAGAEALSRAIHGTPGVVVILVLLAVITGYIYLRSRASRVDHKNVNAEWTGSVVPESESAAGRQLTRPSCPRRIALVAA